VMKNVWGYELIFPEDILYSPELLWVKVEPEKLRIGICHIAVRAAKRLVHVDIACRVGTQVKKGDKVGAIETTKAVWEIISPVSGEMVAVNPKISGGNPAPIMKDAYGEGWLFEMKKVSETDTELKRLFRGEAADTKKWIEEQAKAIVPLMEDSD